MPGVEHTRVSNTKASGAREGSPRESTMNLKAKLENRTATISVLGLGYVGLPLAVEFAKVGFPVIGIDVDENRLHKIKTGALDSSDVDANTLSRLVSNGSFILTSSYAAIEQGDVIVICVPTPLSKTKEPDISFILTAAEGILPFLRKGHRRRRDQRNGYRNGDRLIT